MMVENNESVKCLKKFILQLKSKNTNRLYFYGYEDLLKSIDNELIEELTQEERNIYIWFSLACEHKLKLKNKEFILNFLDEIDFKLESENFFEPFNKYSIDTSELIKWIKLNFEKEEVSDVLNKALRNTKKVDGNFNIFDLSYLDVEGQEDKFGMIYLIENFYEEFDESYQDYNFEYPESTVYYKLQQIFFKNKECKEIIHNIKDSNYRHNAYTILSYGNEYTDINVSVFYNILNYIDSDELFLLWSNKKLIDELKSFNNLTFVMDELYERLYLNLEKKEMFDELFKCSLSKENAFILAPYHYLINKLTKDDIKKYIKKIKHIKDYDTLDLILTTILSPLELLKLKLILKTFEDNGVSESFESFVLTKKIIDILKTSITNDLRISDEAYKLIKLNHTI